MKTIVSSEQMKHCDRNTIERFKVPSLVLMERAALAVLHLGALASDKAVTELLIVCGNGNNGADGLALARLARLSFDKQFQVTVVQPGANDANVHRSLENEQQREILAAYGIPIEETIPDKRYDTVVDAIFGIGLSRAPTGVYAGLLRRMNELNAHKVAIDMPSGVDSDTGRCYEDCFCADCTVTFAFQKTGQLLYPGCEACGCVKVADIGITADSWLERKPTCFALEPSDYGLMPKRPAHSNKGSFGKVLVVGGDVGMAGAAMFCAQAAYRVGCGLVKLCTVEENRQIIQSCLPEAVLVTVDSNIPDEDSILDSITWADAIAIGPGLGKRMLARRLLELVLEHARVPVVIDADGLNILSENPELLRSHRQQVIVTPHLGEMSRLTGYSIEALCQDLPGYAKEFANDYHCTCVLKDARTVTALEDQTIYINTSGSSALAKGGSGDVLTGIILGLLAQKTDLAAPVGVYLHGLAGESAGRHCSDYSVLARDLLDEIKSVISCGVQRQGNDG